MYMELTREETEAMLFELFENSLHWFEFPRVNIYDYEIALEEYNITLSKEEINIIATYMIVEWIGQQLASIENIRMKYSGSDFKFTSQANHMHKLTNLQKEYERKGRNKYGKLSQRSNQRRRRTGARRSPARGTRPPCRG